jgi:ABC-type dipeptide/oligopeptide/nickel transport system permease component
MVTYLTRRLLLMIPTILGITFLVFCLVALSPGGIGAGLMVSGGQMSDASKVAQMQAYLEDRYGLNDNVLVQYGRWLGRVAPIKFGQMDLATANGERISPPRTLAEPPLPAYAGAVLPPTGSTLQLAPEGEERQRQFRQVLQRSAAARAAYVGATREFRTQLATYARAAGLADALDAKGAIRLEKLEGTTPNTALPEWKAVEASGLAMRNAYVAAESARLDAQLAFEAEPFERSGFSIIPGVIGLDTPDLGVAFSKNRPVVDLLMAALPVTLLLNLVAFPIIYAIAIPTGILAATRRGSWFDTFSGALFVALWSIPVVWAGVLAIGYLANQRYLGLFPVSGLHDPQADTFTYLPTFGPNGWERGYLLDLLWHIVLPVSCLVYGGFAVLSKQTRAAMLDNFNMDYVRTAKAKGVPRKDVVLRHVFRNSLLPLITMFVSVFPATLAGSVVVERIFSIPGMGSLILEAINLRDRELILANTFMIAAVNLTALLIADILYALADPRVTYD